MDMMINDKGEVALTYYQSGQIYISGSRTATGREYVFTTRFAGVCLAWVDPMDAPIIRALRGGCCGRRRPLFDYANQSQVEIWTKGQR